MREITKKMKDFSVENLSLDIPRGFITGFIGPNGAGKSTTIRMIMDIVKPDDGDIKLFGKPHTDAELKQKVGFVYDDLYFYEDFTINKTKSVLSTLYKNWDEELFQRYFKKFQLPISKKIKHFSKGMKMKCSLLFALAHRPEFIIMDEPTSGLDPVFRRELLEELQELMMNENQTIFFSTHITTDLDQIADFIVFIHEGKIKFRKNIEDVREQYYIVKGEEWQLDADLKQMFLGYKVTNQGFTGLMENNRELFDGITELMIEPASLEDIMYYMTREEGVK
ncbi:ABC transporter ATP-binding protein [Thalassobacillus pellis]|uniref:ABC transporter ATP-binding protein n=1 Tax=Thalassobacillus pellis TaxID=748008 RepID=UPI00196031C6|nr:ABC transporter ATP-binding protein [Thalassobacillus pellis]